MNLGALFSLLFSHLSKPTPNLYVDLVALSSTPTQVLFNHFLTQNSFLKTCSQIDNLLLKLGILFGSIEKLTLKRDTRFTWRE
jgi:hypothetical protein